MFIYKKKYSYILGAIAILFVSCQKEDITTSENTTSPIKTNYSQNPDAQPLDSIAKIICQISYDSEIFNEVKQGVDASLKFGRDEEYRFKDILEPQASKFLRSSVYSELASRIRSKIGQTLRSSDSDTLSLEYKMINNNIQIYWPYSEDWNGIEAPVIAFDPKTDDVEIIKAYKRVVDSNGSVRIETLMVNEEYAKKHPVWIINKNETDYQSLPNFTKKEFSKNGILYAQFGGNLFTKNSLRSAYPLDDPKYIYNINIGKVKATKQYDTWVAGGSEFRFRMVGATKDNATGVIADYSTGVVRVDLTRKNISKGQTKDVYSLINMDWGPEETFNGFAVWEEDDGANEKKIDVSIGYKDIKISTSFNIQNHDESIYQIGMERGAFFSGNGIDGGHGLWDKYRIYMSGDVYWSLSELIIPRAY